MKEKDLMGTYATFCAEIRKNGRWVSNTEEIFTFSPEAWQRERGDTRQFWEFPFESQSYSLFGFLAGVRNGSKSAILKNPCGLPEDASDDAVKLLAPNIDPEDIFGTFGSPPSTLESVSERVSAGRGDNYGYSWLSLTELLAFDYNQSFSDEREIPLKETTYREFLGERYFENLKSLQRLGHPDEVRILFCFNG